jgi:arylsulfatase A
MGEIKGFSALIVARQFREWLKEHRREGSPFFVTIWFHEPHGPINSDPEYLARYPKIKDPSLAQYYANVTQIDEAVGVIVEALKELDLFDSTLLSYTSDNGPEGPHEFGTFNQSDSPYDGSRYRGTTGGLRGRKKHTHEGGIRVPGIISWPKGFQEAGIKPGTICSEPVIGSDAFATTLEAAGVPVPEDRVLDGQSILPLLQNQPFTRKKPLYWRNTFFEFVVAIREGDWKLLADPLREKFELHNLANDPRETFDVSAQFPEIFVDLKQKLIAYDDEVLKEGPKWWQEETRPGTMNMTMPEPMW